MSITINFLRRKTTKEQVWKALNLVVALATILNVSGAAIWLQPKVAAAASWPSDNLWTIPVCNDDPANDENPDSVDLKAAGSEYGAAYYISNDTLFLRERVNGNPGGGAGGTNWDQYAWVFMIQKDAASTNYDYLVSLRGSGAGENIELWENTTKAGPIDWSPIFNDPAETQLQTWPTANNSRATVVGSDYYVDWQIPLSELTSRGVVVNNGKFSGNHGLDWATSTNANNYNKDHLNCYDAPDLRVTKEVRLNSTGNWFTDSRTNGVNGVPGDLLNYRITVTNVGGPTQSVTTVTDELGKNFADGDGDAAHNVNPSTQYSDWTSGLNLNHDGNGNPFTGAWGNGSSDGQNTDTLALTIPLISGGGASESFSFNATSLASLPNGNNLLENVVTVGQQSAETDVVLVSTPSRTPNPPLGQSCGLDIGLVVDTSGSVNSTEMGQMKTALTNFAAAFTGTPTVFSLSSFNTNSTQNRAFSRTPAQIAADITSDIPSSGDGNTNWDSGLSRGFATFDPRAAKANLIVIATDGSPNRFGYPTANTTFDWNLGLLNAIPTANAIKLAGTRVVVVGIGEDTSDPATPAQKLDKMKAISGDTVATTPGDITTATDVIKVTDFSGIGAALSAYANQLCGGKILVQKQFDTNGDGVADVTGNTENALLAGYTFDVDGAPSNPGAQVTTNTGALEFSVLNGTYSLTETNLPVNTRVISMQCVNGTQPVGTVNLQNRTVSGLTMGTDDTISCTVVNAYTYGSLKVTKVVSSGAATPDQFGFRMVGSNGSYTYPTAGQNNVVFSNLQPGSYSLEETGPNGYHQTNSTCSNVQVVAGQQATCTFTNARDTGTLIVKKVLVNDNGGNAVVTDFGFKVNGGSTVVFEADGQNDMTVVSGTYSVVENPAAGYTTTYNNCSNVVIPNGGTATCTITNNDIAPTITLNKVVINNNGGNAGVNDFGLTIGGTPVNSGQTLTVMANTPIALNEAGPAGYTFVSLTGDAKCPAVLNGTVTLNEGENVTCTITNDDVAPTITLNKVVINNNGGNAGVNDFGLTVGGVAVTSGQVKAVNANTPIALNEAGLTGYTFVSLTGDAKCPTVLGGTATLNEGENITCTITNDDVAPTITLNKVVINNNGGTAGVNDFGLTIGGTPVNSGQSLVVNSNTPIALNEAGLFGYSFVSLTGDAKCPQVLNGTVTLNEGENVTCTITNDDVAPKLTVYKIVINNDGGTAVAGDFTLNVNATNPTPGQFAGSATGTLVTLNQGAYEVTEDYFPGYSPAFSADCVGSISVGQEKSCFVTNTDDTPHLVVIKHVINDDGGSNVASDFTMQVNGTDVSASSFPGAETGTTVSLDAGTYNVTESGPAGYVASYSDDCNGTIGLGQTKICTVTNNDIAPELTVIKHVVNDNGGNNVAADFTMQVNGTNVSDSEFPGSETGTTVTLNAGAYSVGEIGLSGYVGTFSDDCSGTIAVGEKKTCTVTNNDQAASITLNKFVINNNGGTAGVNDFGLTIGGTSVDSGDTLDVSANTPIALNEAGLFGYSFVSIGGDLKCPAVLGGTVTLNEGEHVSCTITNNDISPELTVIKHVVNDNGGNNVAADFTMQVAGTNVSDNEFPGNESGTTITLNQGAYSVDEVAFAGYAKSLGQNCVGSINVGEKKTCTITNDDIQATVDIEKTASPDPVQSGAVLTYTLAWTITGQGFVKDAVITDTIPAITTYLAGSIACGTTTGTCTTDDSTSTLVWELGDRVAGETGTVTFQVTIDNLLQSGTEITNTACLNAGDRQQDCDTTTTEVKSDFTVNIVKTDNIDPVLAGGQVTYTLAWTTSGNAPINNLVITDPVPANLTFVSATNGGTLIGGVVTWNLGPKTPGDFGSVTVTMRAASPIANGTVVTNIATVCGTMFTSQEQTVQHCDDDDETTTISSTPSISITKTNNVAGFTNPGKTVTYTVVVTNAANATDTANTVVMTDILPAGFTFADTGLATKSFNLGTIAPGASVTTTYVVNISAGQLAGIYTNTASAQGSNTGKVSATSNVDVRSPQILGSSSSPELSITKKVKPTVTNPGKIINYTVVVKNIGDADAENVVITDTLPKGFTFVDGGKSTKTWNIGTLKVNHERVLNYQVMVGENVRAGKYVNVAVVTADGMAEEARATVEVKVPKVLGLATTGASARDYAFFVLGLSLMALGGRWLVRQRRSNSSIA